MNIQHGEVRKVNGKRVASPEYRAWQNMRNRCLNSNAPDYRYYGGRGITICAEWNDFTVFLADMGRRPSPAHSLDRRDGDGDYERDNCRWATKEEQARNREYASTKAWELAQELGIKKMTAHHIIWQVRAKDKGDTKWFGLSPEMEQKVRAHLTRVEGVPCKS